LQTPSRTLYLPPCLPHPALIWPTSHTHTSINTIHNNLNIIYQNNHLEAIDRHSCTTTATDNHHSHLGSNSIGNTSQTASPSTLSNTKVSVYVLIWKHRSSLYSYSVSAHLPSRSNSRSAQCHLISESRPTLLQSTLPSTHDHQPCHHQQRDKG
jgi:hypothetical protein